MKRKPGIIKNLIERRRRIKLIKENFLYAYFLKPRNLLGLDDRIIAHKEIFCSM